MHIETVHSSQMLASTRAEVLTLCEVVYSEKLDEYLVNAGPGLHLLGRVSDELVSIEWRPGEVW